MTRIRTTGLLTLALCSVMTDTASAGAWGMDPVIGITGDYATNPVLIQAPDTADTSSAVLLDAPTTYYADALKLSLLPSFRLSDTKGYSSVTSDYEHLNVKGEYDTERSVLTTTAGVSRDSSLFYDYLSNGTTGVRRDAGTADINLDRLLTERFELNGDASVTRVRYGEATGVATLVDYHYTSLASTLILNTAERNKYTLSANVGRYDSLDGITESRNGNLQVGFQRQLSELWSLTASGGYSRALDRSDTVEPKCNQFSPQCYTIIDGRLYQLTVPVILRSAQDGTVYAVSLTHQGTLVNLTASASRQIQASGFALLSRQQSYELRATYTPAPRWTLTTDIRQVEYHNPLASGQYYDVKVPFASLAAGWQWTERWSVTLTASYVRESAPTSLISEDSKEILLTLSRTFRHQTFQ